MPRAESVGDRASVTNVDCYQRAEGRYRLMREVIPALSGVANPFSILTRAP
jgi:DNA repair photolyase